MAIDSHVEKPNLKNDDKKKRAVDPNPGRVGGFNSATRGCLAPPNDQAIKPSCASKL
jgi:hypothetical protein